MAKPDDRSDNVERLEESIDQTLDRAGDTRDYLNAHEDEIGPEQRQDLAEKNDRREEAVEGFRAEIADEAHHREG